MSLDQPKLNRVEIWIAEHSIRIFLVIALAIVAAVVAFIVVYSQQGDTATTVNKVLRPQVTRINKAICDRRSLTDVTRARRCAERIRVGLVNCRQVASCRAAFAAALRPPVVQPAGEGVMPQSPSKTGQQPAPGSNPGDHGQGQGHPNGHPQGEKPPKPTPQADPGGHSEGQQGGQSAPESQGSPSGAAVEVCVAGVTCVEADVGLPDLKPKGQLP